MGKSDFRKIVRIHKKKGERRGFSALTFRQLLKYFSQALRSPCRSWDISVLVGMLLRTLPGYTRESVLVPGRYWVGIPGQLCFVCTFAFFGLWHWKTHQLRNFPDRLSLKKRKAMIKYLLIHRKKYRHYLNVKHIHSPNSIVYPLLITFESQIPSISTALHPLQKYLVDTKLKPWW